ncbi:MAG: cysteine hydrolase [Albidovulum sp.]|nr:cysteine hydrolase [Albidovulum sp.]MDE0305163.1 cysteine hydrolase [Albidovulum sp.]MDE0530248.1 cysteine hydrolase [Albidovulum sp.]
MKTALIVIDMQNSFLHSDCEHFYAEAPDIVPNCLALIRTARQRGSIIVHTADRHRKNFTDFELKRLPAHCVIGGFHAQYFTGFGPGDGTHEIEIEKRRFSAFFATELALFLREQSVERLIFCGIKTNVCVRATAQDAFAHGFEVFVVADATNSNRPHLAAASLEDIRRYFGQLVSTSEAMELLA